MMVKTEKNVLVISYHFYPDIAVGGKRPSALVRALVDAGYKVDVIAKRMDSEAEVLRKKKFSEVRFFSIWKPPLIIDSLWLYLKGSFVFRYFQKRQKAVVLPEENVLDLTGKGERGHETLSAKVRRHILSFQALLSANKMWVLFSILTLLWLKLSNKKYQTIISTSPLDSVHLVGLVANKIFCSVWLMDIRDPMNSWYKNNNVSNSGFRWFIENSLERRYYDKATCITCSSRGLAERLRKTVTPSGKIRLIYNGYDGDLSAPRSRPFHQLRLIFGGMLYIGRNPIPLFEALEKLAYSANVDRSKLVFDLYGECETWNGIDLVDWVERRSLTDIIHFYPKISQEALDKEMEDSALLVSFAQNQPIQTPAKTFDQIAANREIFVFAEKDSDTAALIEENLLGVTIGENDDISLHLERKYDYYVRRGLLFSVSLDSREQFSRVKANEMFVSLVGGLKSSDVD